MMIRNLAVWCMFCCVALLPGRIHGADANEALRAECDRLFDAPAWRNAHWGVMIVDLTTSEVLYEREAGKGFMPASNMKLYTTAAALKTLGPDYRYQTKICLNGKVTANGTLKGDVVVIGSGDPSISGRYSQETSTTTILRTWADAVRAAGVRRIEGAVIADGEFFEDEPRCGSWQLDYYQDWYAAESSGLAMNENCYDFIVRPGKEIGKPASLQIELPTKFLTVRNEILTTGPAKNPQADPPINYSRPLDGNEILFSGFVPINTPSYKHWASVHDGNLYAATLFVEQLEKSGVRVRAGAQDSRKIKDRKDRLDPQRMKTVHTHVSPPLSRIVAIVNKPSQNFYADHLLKTMGKVFYGKGDFETGAKVVRDFLTTAGADVSGFRMVDGSGLSRQNLVQPQMTVALLAFMSRQPEFQVFFDSLPIAGVDGTIKPRMKGTPAVANVHAKTGYIGSVRSLSGYATTADKHRIVFCTMANNYTVETSLANSTQDALAVALCNLGKNDGSTSTTAGQ